MRKLLRKLGLVALFISIIEIVSFGIFIGLYLGNIWNFQETVSPTIFGYISIGIVLLNLIAIFFAIFFIQLLNQKNFLKTEDVIGSEVAQIYAFGGIGYIVLDDENRVIWTSELFEKKEVEIIGDDIYGWCPELMELSTSNKEDFEKTIKIKDSFYRVKYLKNNRVFIFKDVSDYENALILFNKNSLAIGIIMIDNYSDIAANNEDINDVIPRIKSQITNYGKQHHLVLRSFKNDSFLVLARNEDLEEMKADGFDILNQVRSLGIKEDIKTSLSIAFAYDYSTIYQINEMASNALSVAMSRGGDQAVVAQMNHELLFYGGKTEATENRNKVKVKSDANALLNYITQNKDGKIFIMGHTEMDMDALGACLGVKQICNYLKCKEAYIVYDSKLTEGKTRSALITSFPRDELEKFIISPKDAENSCDNSSLLIICDVNNPAMMMDKNLIDKTDKIIIIDHHRRGTNFVESLLLSIIDTSASSASELITEIIKYGSTFPPIPVDERVATIMLSGIFLDTGYFKANSVGVRTFEASMVLKEYGADNSKADDFLKDEIEEYTQINSIVQTMKTPFTGVVYCTANNQDILEQATIAKACNECMHLKGMDAAFVIGRISENTIKISARSNGSTNVQLIMEKLGGGGHFSGASAQFKDMSVEQVEKKLEEALENHLADAQKNVTKEN